MKYPIGIITLSFSIVFASFFINSIETKDFPLPDPDSVTIEQSSLLNCPVTCNVQDSLILVKLYDSTLGSAFMWNNFWFLGNPVCSWHGITVNSSGFVEKIELDNNNLKGVLPPDFGAGNLTQLKLLLLYNNEIGGSLPPAMGNLSTVETMWVDDNEFTGTVPSSFGGLSSLVSFFLDNNQITGKIPISILSLSNLQFLEFFDNQIDSVPDLSSLTLTADRLRMHINRLTFDDILPNWGGALADNYFPQDSFGNAYTVNLTTGSSYIIDLGIDEGITTSTYFWYQNGSLIATTTVNKLDISPISFADAGEYRVRVTNSIATQLTLHRRPITINITCGLSINNFSDSLCLGQTVSFNNTTYSKNNPTDTIFLAGATIPDGCDSVIYINLFYPDGEAIEDFRDTICRGDTIFVNGDPYHENHLVGFYFFPGGSIFECDSILNVNIGLYPQSATGTYNPTICRGDTLMYMGEFYYEGKENGMATIGDSDINGCDSTVAVTLSFYPPNEVTFDQTLCLDDSITINNVIYHAANPTGRDTLTDQNGCDSILIIDLAFDAFASGEYRATLCFGDSVILNGITYNTANPTGTDTIPDGSVGMCDSIFTVDIDFYPLATGTFAPTICPEGDVTVNGMVYDKDTPKDTLYFTNPNGCDSTLYIDLQFYPEIIVDYTPDLCPGDSVIVNGQVYNQSRLNGTEVFPGVSANGCDSTVNVAVNLLTEPMGTFSSTLCLGDSITINGTIYHENNRTGIEHISGVAPNGCDSVINVSIDFYPRAEGNLTLQICDGKCVDYNGKTYCSADANDIAVLANAAFNGCDSFVVITIQELPNAAGTFNTFLCPGDSVLYNGTYYHDGNRTGTETIGGVAPNSCDSVIFVSVSFYDTVKFDLTGALCFGESIIVNGTVYDETHRTGTEILENQAQNGCDSIVNIDLDFMAFALANFNPTLCFGDSIIINGVTYDTDNRTGKDTLIDASTSGCDSIICVDIDFYPEALMLIDTTLCPGEVLVVNGIIYDESRLSGMDTLGGLATGGCDSIVQIMIDYFPAAEEDVFITLCPGDSITINDTIYHAGKILGSHLFGLASINGCDSTLTVHIDFYAIAEEEINADICPGQSIVINGKTYDQSNTSGRDTLQHPVTGCDSILIISITVSDTLKNTIDDKWCFDQSMEINGTPYNYFNRTGTEFLLTAAGCDSMITIDLDFYEEIRDTLDGTYCNNQSFVVNNQVYDKDTPSGTEIMMAAGGCDSIVVIDLNFINALSGTLDGIWCNEQSFEINGNTYDKDNPSGTETLTASGGCDSIVTIDLDFYAKAELSISGFRCFGNDEIVNGVTYDFDNPAGVETISNANGCDSIVTIDLDFAPKAIYELEETWCFDESININGQVYDYNNRTDTIALTTPNGCDSTIMIRLDFYDEAKSIMEESICEGENFEVGGNIYTEEGAYQITLKGTSVNGCDSLIELNLAVVTIESLGYADAGDDQLACDTEAPISANLPGGLSGEWSCIGSSEVVDPASPVSTVQNLEEGNNMLIWTLSSPQCPEYDADTLLIELEPLPETFDDDYTLSPSEISANLNILANDDFLVDIDWFVELVAPLPDGATFELMADDKILFTPDPEFSGTLSFNYSLCSENCPDRCSFAEVRILVEEEPLLIDTTVAIPNGITPNGDGLNDIFIVDVLETNPELYPDNELVIFNRWGDIVYEASPYLNDWDGKSKNGKELPQGTYYYVLRLKLESGEIFKGDVTILK